MISPESTTAIVNATIMRPDEEPREGSILFRGGKIYKLLPEASPALPKTFQSIDARGDYVCPGLIDLHVHGGGGRQFLINPARNFFPILQTHARFGTTSLLPTLTASSCEDLMEFIRFIKKLPARSKFPGCVPGLNLEGPFLSIGQRGAQPLRFIRLPRIKDVERILEEANGCLKIMTLAPELEGGIKLIEILKKAGVVPAIGHTSADYETTRRAIRSGLSYATHIFNSYPPLHHRQPGALAAILESDKLNVEILADGVHVSPVFIRLLFRLQQFNKIILVTDATAALGEKIRRFTMAGREVQVVAGRAQLQDGTLVGSVVPINQAVKNVVKFTGIPLPRILSLATTHPARVLGLEGKKGDLKEGMDADILILDKKFNVRRTIIGGETVYRKKPE